MNKENVISHFATGVALLVLGAISLHFISAEYTLGVGYLVGLLQSLAQPKVKSILFKK